jgi:hypothetical protein
MYNYITDESTSNELEKKMMFCSQACPSSGTLMKPTNLALQNKSQR